MNKKYLSILLHLFGWIAFFLVQALLFTITPATEPPLTNNLYYHFAASPPSLFFLFIKNLFLILFFYINLYLLLPRIYDTDKKFTYFLIVLLVMVTAIFLPAYTKYAVFSNVKSALLKNGLLRDPGLVFGFLHFLIIWFLSTIVHLTSRYQLLDQKNKDLKVQQLNAELSYLKAQINPHFLFNTLNNIYALSICHNEQTPEAILKLSAIMRYVTQNAATDTVPLKNDIAYLKNYIALQQLRSANKLTVQFTVTGETGSDVIAPLLLINFIENAFKYGVSSHTPCYVHIDIQIIDNQLTLKVTNKLLALSVEESTFTGTSNTLRRLQLQYANKHDFKIDESNNLYKIILQLDLA